MIDLISFWFATLPPLGLLLVALVVFLLGYFAGLYGLTRAENRAFSRLIAAHQRRRLAVCEARQ